MSAGLSDTEIISQVLLGNTQAYARLVHRYQDYVFTLSMRMVKNREVAEELAQDVFIKAFRHLASFRAEAKFSTWLFTIANNTCITHLRKKKPEIHSLEHEKVLAAAEQKNEGPAVILAEQKSKQEMVRKAVSLLGADDAQIITLFYHAEQSLEEIARILGVEPNTAKVRLHRARSRLKEKIETHFAEELN